MCKPVKRMLFSPKPFRSVTHNSYFRRLRTNTNISFTQLVLATISTVLGKQDHAAEEKNKNIKNTCIAFILTILPKTDIP